LIEKPGPTVTFSAVAVAADWAGAGQQRGSEHQGERQQ
jgi:hypothetical protein